MSVYLFCLLVSIVFLILILYFVKKRALDFKYSIVWLMTSGILVVFSLNKEFTEFAAAKLNIAYPPAFLFLIGVLFILFLLLHLTLVISHLQNALTKVIQEISLLKAQEGMKK